MREIIKARALRITLLKAGANLLPTIYKSLEGKPDGEGEFQVIALSKAGEEEGELLNVIVAPDRPDGHKDWMSKAAVKEMAHSAARDGVEIDLYHDGKNLTKEQAYVAESFLVQETDPRFHDWEDADGEPVGSLEGAYATIMKVDDPDLRSRIKSGELAEVSFEGPALVRASKAKEDTPPTWLTKLLKALGLGSSPNPDPEDMNKQDTEALFTAMLEKALEKKPDPTPAEPKASTVDLTDPIALKKHLQKLEDEAVDLKDPVALKKHLQKLEDEATPDLTDPAAIKKHLEKLEAVELRKGVDFGDAKQVETYLTKLQKAQGIEDDADEDDEDFGDNEVFEDELALSEGDTQEIKALKQRTRKAEKRSNREPDTAEVNLFKGMDPKRAKQIQIGRKMADFINGDQN